MSTRRTRAAFLSLLVAGLSTAVCAEDGQRACDKAKVVIAPPEGGRTEVVIQYAKLALDKEDEDRLSSADLRIVSCLHRIRRCLVSYPSVWGLPEVVAPKLTKDIRAFKKGAGGPAHQPVKVGDFSVDSKVFLAAPTSQELPLDRYDELQGELRSMNAGEAWEGVSADSPIVTAVVDSGVDLDHPEFAGQLRTGATFPCRGLPCNGDAAPNEHHGTRMAGLIAAEKPSDLGVVGVAWNTKILPVRFTTRDVSSDYYAACAISYAIAQENVKVINASWHSFSELPHVRDLLKKMVDDKAPQLVVVAAGNRSVSDGGNIDYRSYPASYDSPNLLVVMSHDADFKVSSQSIWGPVSVDVAAPGNGWSTRICGQSLEKDCYEPAFYAMTSTSAAFVSGAAALLWSKYPDWTYSQIKQRIMDNSIREPALKDKSVTGARLDLLRVIRPVRVIGAEEGRIKLSKGSQRIHLDTAFPAGVCKYEPQVEVRVGNRVRNDSFDAKARTLLAGKLQPNDEVRIKARCENAAGKPVEAESRLYKIE